MADNPRFVGSRCPPFKSADVLASFEEILAEYRSLEREDILAAIDYAAQAG